MATALVGLGCGDDEPRFERYEPEPGTPEAIAWEAGITEYLGTIEPSAVRVDEANTVYRFDPADGPVCLRGAEFAMSVEERESNDLLIYLQGGGACWSDFCLAITSSQPNIPGSDVLRTGDENPLADFDIVYVPYCDGSLFAGDNDIDEDGDGTPDRLHHGLQNLSAALSQGWLHFPNPDRVVLAGSSGGGFGTILATYLVRYVYPDVPLYVLNDAGVGVAKGADPAFVEQLMDEFGARSLIPEDCPDCIADGHITGLVDYILDRDPNLRVAAISSWYDSIISQTFLMVDQATFAADLESETTQLHAEHPSQYRRYLYPGDAHTALLGTVAGIVGSDLGAVELPPNSLELLGGITIESIYTLENEGVLLADWIAAMIGDDLQAWSDLTSDPGPPPAP